MNDSQKSKQESCQVLSFRVDKLELDICERFSEFGYENRTEFIIAAVDWFHSLGYQNQITIRDKKRKSNCALVASKKLYLYLLSQDINNKWDTYDEMVICAESEKEAIEISFRNYSLKHLIEVKRIGVADKSVEKGLVSSSYRNG